MEDKAKCVFLVFGGGGVEQGGPSDGLKILPAANFCRKIIRLTKNRVEDKARLDFVFFGAGEGVKQGGPRDSLRILPAKYFCRKITNQAKDRVEDKAGFIFLFFGVGDESNQASTHYIEDDARNPILL